MTTQKNKLGVKRNLSWSKDADRLLEIEQIIQNTDQLTAREIELLGDYVLKTAEGSGEFFWTFEDLPKDSGRMADIADSFEFMEPHFATAPLQIHKTHKLHRTEVMRLLQKHEEHVVELWFQLWNAIDETEYKTQWRDLKDNRRTAPIRDKLIERLSFKGRQGIEDKSVLSGTKLNDYLKSLEGKALNYNERQLKAAKMELVRLRQEQYVHLDNLRGSLHTIHMRDNRARAWFDLTDYVNVYPFDVKGVPFDTWSLQSVADSWDYAYRVLQSEKKKGTSTIDLTDPEVLRVIISEYEDLILWAESNETIATIIHYLDLYADLCAFEPHLLLLYEGRKAGKTAKEIKDEIEEKTGHSYRTNYIYTMFSRQVLKPIAEKASEHLLIVDSVLDGPEKFKRCNTCEVLMPLDKTFFGVRSSTKDGFLNRCRTCTKEMRKKK